MSQDKIVIVLKLKTGEDVLGWYAGEDDDPILEKSILVYRPIKSRQVTMQTPSGIVVSYVSDLYSHFGSPVVSIPYSNVVSRDTASPFFQLYYIRTLGDILALQDSVRDSYVKFYDREDVIDAMKNTDSIYIELESMLQ